LPTNAALLVEEDTGYADKEPFIFGLDEFKEELRILEMEGLQ